MASKKAKRYVEISNDEGAVRLAGAIIKQARQDYIESENPVSAKRFVNSKWFDTLSIGVSDKKTVLNDWERSRYVWRFFDKVRFYDSGADNYKKDARYFRNLVGSRDVTLLEYLIYFNDKYDLHLFDKTTDTDLLSKYGWARQINSHDVCETFRGTVANKQTCKYNPNRVYGYKPGRWILYEGDYYKCVEETSPGEFDPKKWKKLSKEDREAEIKYYLACKDPGYLSRTEPLKEVDW